MRLIKDYDDESTFKDKLLHTYEDIKRENIAKTKHKFRKVTKRYCTAGHGRHVFDVNRSKGYQRIELIYEYLNKLYRSPQQKEFHNMFIASILRIIFEEDFNKERHIAMAKYAFETRKQQVLLCCPRRLGKTWSVAFFTVVISIVLSGQEISIFSPGKRQSVALMNHIYNFVKKLEETSRVLRRNEEKMVMRSLDGGESIINAYPSAVKTLKGVSGTIVVLEEMAVIDPAVLFEVVVPLHQIDITSIIGISTITDEYNFMTRYLSKKDPHGEQLFAVKHIFLACDECKAAGKAASCNHNAYLLPNWSSPRKRRIINCIMEDHQEMLAREIGGVANSLNERAFPHGLVDQLLEKERYFLETRVSYPQVFIAIDPNGCGKKSDFAMTTILRYCGKYVILGMESFPSKTPRENHELIFEHVERLMYKECFYNSLKVFILESNYGLESAHINEALKSRGMRNYLVMSEREDIRIGFETTNSNKDIATSATREKLADNTLEILPDDELISVTRPPANIIKLLGDQMKDFAMVLKENDLSKPRKFFSGKAAGKDDLVISLILAVYWSGYFFNSGKYDNYFR